MPESGFEAPYNISYSYISIFNLLSENGEYMAFGLSGDDAKSKMVGGDVTVAWVDKDTLKGHAIDYYLDAKSQCSGGRGSCPDEKIAVSNTLKVFR